MAQLQSSKSEGKNVGNIGNILLVSVQKEIAVSTIVSRMGPFGWANFVEQNQNNECVLAFLKNSSHGNLLPRLGEFSMFSLLEFWKSVGDIKDDCPPPTSQQDLQRWQLGYAGFFDAQTSYRNGQHARY
jgi:hypothetical protein